MNKNVLITGGSSGIGYELAKIFGKNGYDVIIVARDKDKLTVAENNLKEKGYSVIGYPYDLTDTNVIFELHKTLADKNIQIDILINNAGFATYGKFAENNLKTELTEINLNIIALTQLTKLFLQDMLKKDSGKILNVASTAAFAPGPFMAVYYASKSYVLSFSQALNEELRGTGVTVSALCPGPTDSGFAKRGGVWNSPLFHGKLTSASFVANAAYNGLMKNKSVIVPKWKDWLLIYGARFMPIQLVPKIVYKLQSSI